MWYVMASHGQRGIAALLLLEGDSQGSHPLDNSGARLSLTARRSKAEAPRRAVRDGESECCSRHGRNPGIGFAGGFDRHGRIGQRADRHARHLPRTEADAAADLHNFSIGSRSIRLREANQERRPKASVDRPLLPVDLSYLITPWAKDPRDEHLMLGRIVQGLHDRAVLSGTDLIGCRGRRGFRAVGAGDDDDAGAILHLGHRRNAVPAVAELCGADFGRDRRRGIVMVDVPGSGTPSPGHVPLISSRYL